jgi:serine/threonine protein kinase
MTTTYPSIGKYRILGEIARGSFGRVYRGEDTSHQNYPVAIKLMHAAYLADAAERHSFMQEAHLLTMLHHSYIVPVLDVGIENDLPYLVMEYAPNGSLHDRLKQQASRPLPFNEALKILGQVGAALQYAHQQNIIHRDLKPANILFNAQGDALLADFSIATMLETSMKSGTVVGTPHYMAPEQFRGAISKEGDQYALGCIAYQVMTGHRPFDAPDFFALAYKHLSETIIPPRQLNPLIPYPIEAAICKAMAKQRTDRFPDVLAFVNALGAPVPAIALARPAAPPPITETAPFPTPVVADKGEDKGNHTLKRSHYIKEEGLDTFPIQTEIFPLRQVVHEEEGMPAPSGRGGHIGASPSAGIQEVEGGQPFAFASAPPHLLNVSDQARVQSGVLPHIIEGPITRTPSPGGIMRAGSYGDEDRAAAAAISAGRASHGDDDEDNSVSARKNLEGDDGPGYLNGAGTLIGPGGPTSWSMGTQPDPTRGSQKKRKRHGIILIAASAALLFVLISGGVLYAMLGITRHPAKPQPPAPSAANVTITPVRNTIARTYTIDAITGAPDAAKNQVQASHISVSEGMQSRTITATGQGSTSAQNARGAVLVANHESKAETFSAGYTLSAGNGYTVTFTQSFTLQSLQYIHASSYVSPAGSGGNLARGAINEEILPNDDGNNGYVYVFSYQYSGGQNASNYTYVSQADMNNASNAASQMQAAETSSGQSAITSQMGSSEQMWGGVSCSPNKTYNHSAGDRASSVTASVSVSCSAEIYDQGGAQALAASLLKNAVKATPNVALIGQPATSVINVSGGSNGTVILKIVATGTEVATFSAAQKQRLAKLIAGATVQEAQDILVNQAGIGKVVVIIHSGQTLPKDAAHITIVVAQP